MKLLTILAVLAALAACGSESSDSETVEIRSDYMTAGITNYDSTSYVVRVGTINSKTFESTFIPLLDPSGPGPSVHSVTVTGVPATSSENETYFFLNLPNGGGFVDASPEFPYSGGSEVVYLRISGGTIQWARTPSGPWN